MERDYDKKVKKFLKAVKENRISDVEKALKDAKQVLENVNSLGSDDRFDNYQIHPMVCDDNFDNPLILASLHGHFDMLKMLVEKIPEKHRKEYISLMGNQIGVTPIIAACASGSVKVLHSLINYILPHTDLPNTSLPIILPYADLLNTCLGIACSRGNLEIVQYLISSGIKFEAVLNSFCPHPLMLAMINGHEQILIYFYLPNLARSPKLKFLSEEIQEKVSEFLKMVSEADIEKIPNVDIDECCTEFHGINILALAVILQLNDMFYLLLELGADLETKITSGKTVQILAEEFKFNTTPNLNSSMASSVTINTADISSISSSKKSKLRKLLSFFKQRK